MGATIPSCYHTFVIVGAIPSFPCSGLAAIYHETQSDLCLQLLDKAAEVSSMLEIKLDNNRAEKRVSKLLGLLEAETDQGDRLVQIKSLWESLK